MFALILLDEGFMGEDLFCRCRASWWRGLGVQSFLGNLGLRDFRGLGLLVL